MRRADRSRVLLERCIAIANEQEDDTNEYAWRFLVGAAFIGWRGMVASGEAEEARALLLTVAREDES